jgi:hypothetical protein
MKDNTKATETEKETLETKATEVETETLEGTQETDKDTLEKENDFDIKQVLENPEFKKIIDQLSDKRVTDAVKKVESKYKKQLEEETKKINMTAEEILAEKEKELVKRELKLETVNYFKEKSYDLNIMDFIDGNSLDEVKEKSDLLMGMINAVVDKKVQVEIEERLKNAPRPNTTNKSNPLSLSDIGSLSIEEINKQWNNLK